MADNHSFLTGINSEYIAHLYAKYLSSPSSIDTSWQSFFGDLNDDEVSLLREMHGASWTPDENRREANGFAANTNEIASIPQAQPVPSAPNSESQRRATLDSIRAIMLIRAYRVRGHLEADLDPLGLMKREYHPELDPRHYGFTEADYDREIFIDGVLGMETATLRTIIAALKETYCGKIGVEFMHMSDPEEKAWVQERIEAPHNKTDFTVNGKRAIYQRLVAAEGFENFLHVKHTGTKRFGVDGGEALIPCIEQIMKRGGQLGIEEIAVGMAHRGRLNVLTNVMGKSFTAVFSEFQGVPSTPDDVLGSGDVKYHMGTSSDRDFDGNTIHLSLTANPSHLEFVNPVVIGKVRAKQTQLGQSQDTKVLPLLLHGDAAFAGQGVVPETLMISELPGYRVGGTMHIVINNQIGFTTRPKYSRSGPYCTDVAKLLSAPIFHVNGDDPEAVVHVARIATEFRQKFKKDVVIDMFCYRRYGHNEGDEPSFTQPLMYKKIAEQKTTRQLYGERLVEEKVLTAEEAQQVVDEFNQYMEESFEATKSFKPNKADFLEGAWTGLTTAPDGERRGKTGVEIDTVKRIGQVLTTIPEDFKANSKILRQLKNKEKMFETGENIDWATAEALAFGTLLDDGFGVRLSGQDCGRGTFSQRHAKLYDQETEKKHTPLKTHIIRPASV